MREIMLYGGYIMVHLGIDSVFSAFLALAFWVRAFAA